MYHVHQTKLTFHTTYITLKQKGWKKHLTVFEIRKPACQLSAAFVLTIIMYSDVWSLVEVERCSVKHWMRQWNCLSKQSWLQLQSVISISSFKDVMLLAAVLCYCGYYNRVKKDQWRTVNHKDVHFWHLFWQRGTNKGRHVVKSVQVGSVASSCPLLKQMQLSPNSPQEFAFPLTQNPSC